MSLSDIIITAIPNKRAVTILAHHLAQKPGISLQKAQDMLANLPVIYEKSAREIQTNEILQQLAALGVVAKVVPATLDIPQSRKVTEQKAAPDAAVPAYRRVAEKTVPVYQTAPAQAAERLTRMTVADLDEPVVSKKPPLISTTGIVVILTLLVVAGVMTIAFVTRGRESAGADQSSLVRAPRRAEKKPAKGTDADSRQSGKEVVSPVEAADGKAGSRPAVSEEKKAAAVTYVDSARDAAADATRAIRFYKMAISLNRYNIDAWYGLVAAYTGAGMDREAAQAMKEMSDLFGDGVFSVKGVVEKFGTIEDMSRSEDGTYRVQYHSKVRGEEDLRNEAFNLSRALSLSCKCSALSIFAATAPGRGLLAHVNLQSPLKSRSDFDAAAAVTYLP